MRWQAQFDVVNHSWGWNEPFRDNPLHTDAATATFQQNFLAGITHAADNGRAGLGTIMVVAAGNERLPGGDWNQRDWGTTAAPVNWTTTTWWHSDDTNAHGFKNDRHMVTVGGVGSDSVVAEYSTPGASILVSAPTQARFADSGLTPGDPNQGRPGTTAATTDGIWTTDRTGAAGYNAGNDHAFDGTSAATPIVSGVVALMLEANSNLGWRDVREILAASAEHVGGTVESGDTAGIKTGAELDVWQINGAGHWNGGGMHFSNDYGFGQVNAHAAVRLAETWARQNTSTNEQEVSSANSNRLVLPDGGSGRSFNIVLDGGVQVETIELFLDIQHTEPGELYVVLENAIGTRSVLLQPVGSERLTGLDGWTFMSNEFLGEDSAGVWTVRVTDTTNDEMAVTDGVITGARLTAYGAAQTNDNVYIYTNEFADFANDGLHGFKAYDDNGGVDTINAAAVTTDSIIDLEGGRYRIDGNEGGFGFGTGGDPRYYMIENIFGGDGDDTLVGNVQNNKIAGGYGKDTIEGREGDDILDAGGGVDSLYGGAGSDSLAVDYDYFFAVDVIDGGADTDTVDLSSSAIAMWVDLEYDGREVWTRDRADVDAGTWREFADLVSIENVTGTKASDTIAGDGGRNVLAGGDGNDTLHGRGGNDQLSGGAGVDTLDSGAGDDVLIVDRESHTFAFDVLRGGEGIDTLSLFRFHGVTIDLSSGVFGSTRFFDVENVSGTVLADRIKGDAGDNRIDGRAGNDTVVFDQAYGAYSLRELAPESGKRVIEVTGPDGTDTLVDIEVVEFADRTVNVADLNLAEFPGFDAGDVAFQNAADGQVVFANMHDGAFDSWGSHTGALGTAWRTGATGNVNPAAGEGVEVFFQNAANGMVVYASIDTGATTWGAATGALGTEWKLRGAADVTGDGSADALVQHVDSGAIYFTDLAGGVFQGWGIVSPNLTSDWRMAGAGDINNDGFADVVIQSASTGTTLYADMNGGAFQSWKVVSSAITPDLQVKAVADVSGDGFADVIFQSQTNGTTYFADMANGAFDRWGIVATGITPDWAVEGAADVDDDGSVDVVFQHAGTGATLYADMNPDDATVWGVIATNITSQWEVV